ncbi:FlgD immunoglobulin-like domain containing protein [Treponema berlinense]|uniref:FlgD immunoglobulin-like domain containing protein n=1 Tax=Treponema berlinense TaxID=225004 RepID=UPI0026F2FADE|nr:FlgD immunoglobulin-like domain containing protein [Treponema berlinense]
MKGGFFYKFLTGFLNVFLKGCGGGSKSQALAFYVLKGKFFGGDRAGIVLEFGNFLKKFFAFLGIFCAAGFGGFCDEFYWRGGESGSWYEVSNWKVEDAAGVEIQAARFPVSGDIANFDGDSGAYSSVTIEDSSVTAGEIQSYVGLRFDGNLTSSGEISITTGDLYVGGTFDFSGNVSVTAGKLTVGKKCTAKGAKLDVGGNIEFKTEYEGVKTGYEGAWSYANIECDGELKILGSGIVEDHDSAQFRGTVTAGSIIVEGNKKTSALGGCRFIKTTGGEQSYGGNFLVNNDLSIECSKVTFGGKLVNWGDPNYKSVTITGNAVFNREVGSGSNNEKLKNLSVSGTTSVGGDIYTAGEQSFTGLVTLTAEDIVFSTGGKLTFGGGLRGTGSGNGTVWLCGKAATDWEIEIGGAVSDVGTLVFNGNAVVNSSVSAGGDVIFNKTVTANAGLSAGSNVVFNKDVNLSGSVYAGGNISFAEGGAFNLGWWGRLSSASGNIYLGSETTPVKVDLAYNTGTLNVTVNGTGKKAFFYGGFAEGIGLDLTGSAEIYGSNTFWGNVTIRSAGEVNFKDTNTFKMPVSFENVAVVEFDADNNFDGGFAVKVNENTSPAVVKFQNGSRQKFSSISLQGAGTEKNVTLTVLDASAANPWWQAVFSTPPSEGNFKYSVIDKSWSVTDTGDPNPLGLVPNKDTVFDAGLALDDPYKKATTKDWFTKKYFWLGTFDTDWGSVENWAYAENGENPAFVSPPTDDSECEIVVARGNMETPYILKVSEDLILKNITVGQSAVLDLAGYDVTAENFKNEGTLRLEGKSGQLISAEMSNGSGSTVEYYGQSFDFVWDGDVSDSEIFEYENLKITGSVTSAEKNLVVKGVFSVENSVENDGVEGNILLSGDNVFKGEVLVSRKENENLTFTGNNVFEGKISVSQGGDLTLTGNNVFKGQVGVSNCGNLTLTGKNDFSEELSFSNCGDLTLSGENHFAETVAVKVAGAGNVKINGDSQGFVLDSDAECKTLQVLCPVKLNGSVKTTETSTFDGELTEDFGQFYKENVYVEADAVFTDAAFGENLDSPGKLTFEGNIKIGGDLGTVSSPSSLSVGGTADFSSGSAQKVTTAGNQTYSKKIKARSDLEITASQTQDTETSVVMYGFEGDGALSLTADAAELHYGDYVSVGGQIFNCQTVKISKNPEMDSSTCQWKAGGTENKIMLQGESTESTELFFDFGEEGKPRELILNSSLGSADIFAFSGKLTLKKGVTLAARNFAAWGEAYSAEDSCFGEDNSRFAYFDDESLSPHAREAEIEVSGLENGEAVIAVSGNFYVNGLNLEGLTLKIPDNCDSHPIFNSTSKVTKGQWGLPYAVAFNSTITGIKVLGNSKEEEGWLTAGAEAQNCVDGGGNSQVQFQSPKIQEAYSVYDDVVYVEFDMELENSRGEISSIFDQSYDTLAEGGLWYSGGTVKFEGVYSDKECTVALPAEDIKGFYLKGGTSWNTDATGSAPYGTAKKAETDSTDRKGQHKNVTTDLSFLEGTFSSAKGKVFCQNYGTGIEKGSGAVPPAYNQTEDRASPVLIAAYTGQELHSSGNSSLQKTYDSHNFIEFRYSEAVDIGELKHNEEKINLRAVSGAGNITGNGTLGENSSRQTGVAQTGLTIEGFASIDDGILRAFSKDGSGSPHALYRKFSTKAREEEEIQTHRVRLGIAAFVEGTVTFTDSLNPALNGQYHNWIGCIEKAQTPQGIVTPVENPLVTDLAGNVLDARAREETDIHQLPVLTVNGHTDGFGQKDSVQTGSLYGLWDVLPPVIAPVIKDRNAWTQWSLGEEYGGSAETAETAETAEIIGTSENGSDIIVKFIEIHLFDNDRTQAEKWPENWWRTRKGWSSDLQNAFSLPESRGGARPETEESKTYGGIRLCSLKNENSAFTYRVKNTQNTLDSSINSGISSEEEKNFDGSRDISPAVYSTIFKPKDKATSIDGLYLRLPLEDSTLSVRTVFEVNYNPKDSYITDLAGNLLSSSYREKTCFQSVDLTPPSILLTLAPVGENKIYAVFSKALDLTGDSEEAEGANINSTTTGFTDTGITKAVSDTLLSQIAESFVLVKKASSSGTPPEENKITGAEYVSSSEDYTALLFTLQNSIDLSDVENLWLRNVGWKNSTTEDLLGLTVPDTKIRDFLGNYMQVNTGHTLSDFAINALEVLYAYANQKNSDGWEEKSLYGQNLAPYAEDYAVHDFTAEQGNYGTLLEDRDITLQVKTAGEMPSDRQFVLIPSKKASLEKNMVSDRINALLGTDWRLWLPTPQKTVATSPNTATLTEIYSENAATGDLTLWNYTFRDENYDFKSGDEIQFLFKLTKSDGTDVTIDNDADNFDGAVSPSEEIPLYGIKSPLEKLKAGDFTFVDLWSFKIKGLKQQRGGVTILNNVINVNLREQVVVEVNVPQEGNLNVFVMTLDGNIVRRLNYGRVQAGTHYYRWDGTNVSQKPVARGLYFVRVVGPEIDETRKVLCVKE